ncbi:hypothetical protein TRFO_02853 [Tritrichomonas foetus]|uniref:Uncharacterized protein n=1 Tax=Tritrichomonas foetus TaxID=1144522 RepID=A0A1J4KWC2_9EUKA|nr:hypothetical protein TRFO_02853 [Tritrichomonas foetus]|eukprot:OHT15527.1 hypothetical protein TRFO_02853 [Tritrichomonas foetus]
MAKFMEGVEENPMDDNEWETAIEQRPARLGLGADPKQKQSKSMTNADRRVKNMVANNDSSDSEEFSRSKLGNKK